MIAINLDGFEGDLDRFAEGKAIRGYQACLLAGAFLLTSKCIIPLGSKQQKKATEIIKEVEKVPCGKRLPHLGLCSLERK